MATGQDYEVEQVGVFTPKRSRSTSSARARSASSSPASRPSRRARSATRSPRRAPDAEPFPGFKEMKPMVFAGLYPVEASEYEELRDALEKLR
jgi:GTP-binding protein LepA